MLNRFINKLQNSIILSSKQIIKDKSRKHNFTSLLISILNRKHVNAKYIKSNQEKTLNYK